MPSKKRDQIKRRAGYILRQQQKAAENLVIIRDLFRGVDDRYADVANGILSMMLHSLSEFESFCTHAWGKPPENVERWTQTGRDWRLRRMKGAEFSHVPCPFCEGVVLREELEEIDDDDTGMVLYQCPRCHVPLLMKIPESVQKPEE